VCSHHLRGVEQSVTARGSFDCRTSYVKREVNQLVLNYTQLSGNRNLNALYSQYTVALRSASHEKLRIIRVRNTSLSSFLEFANLLLRALLQQYWLRSSSWHHLLSRGSVRGAAL
jgi:hypothetical protein